MPDTGGGPAVCSLCGRVAPGEEPPLTWTTQLGRRGVERLCERCTREHVRDIEGKLPGDYW
jgi:hypothetical protein